MTDIVTKFKRNKIKHNAWIFALSLVLWLSGYLSLSQDNQTLKTSLINSETSNISYFKAEENIVNAKEVVFNIYSQEDLILDSKYDSEIASNVENYYEVVFTPNKNINKNEKIFTTENNVEIIDSFFIDKNNNIYKVH